MFQDDAVTVNFTSLDGPGEVFLYATDEFGAPMTYFDSSNGLSESDAFPVSVGGHSHQNWGFTAPGIYRVGLTATGTLASGGTPMSSDEAVFLFEVFEPTIFSEGELDIEVAYEDGEWEIVGLDEANEQEICATELVIRGGPETRQTVPDDTAFAFLGSPGAVVNVLPQDETEGVIFLGIAGDEIEPGVFENDLVNLSLIEVNGPGHVSLYAVDEFVSPTVFFNSADGLSESDAFPISVGGHSHQNWGFTAPGVYKVAVQASGVKVGEQDATSSEIVVFTFDILGDDMTMEPLPAYTFRRFDVDGSTGTTLFGINNDGTIVGRYLDVDGVSQGLIYENDSMESFNVTGTTRTLALGINSHGAITGIYEDAGDSDVQHGFLRATDGTITDIDHPAEDFNYAWGINDSGQIAGYFFEDEPFMIRSWQREADGSFSDPFVFPNVGLGAVSRGINDAGTRTGWKWREDFSVEGFFYESGDFTGFFAVDDLPNTLPSDINNHGDTVGNANTAFVNAAGFIRASDGTFRLFRVPDAAQTFAYGINDHRVIVGEYQDANGVNHGFIATPAVQLDSGEVDLEIAFEEGEWEIVLLDESAERELDPSEAVLTALEAAETTVPADEAFEFMHPEGRPLWVLPQDENPDLLFLGTAGDEIPAGVFTDDLVNLDLIGVRGPGEMFFYSVDSFGSPTVFFNSRDGITESDTFPVPVGGHTHNNWAFTAPGIYEVDVQAGGVLVAGDAPSTSEVVTLTFEIFGELPEVSPEPEIEIEVGFEEGEWEIALLDALTLEEYATDELELSLSLAAAEEIPGDPAFSFLGEAGDMFYLIPQNRNTDVLFLGVAGDEVRGGDFENDEVQLNVVSVDGPGDLFVYETDSFGAPTVFVNSADGLGSDDFYPVPVGSHNHANWGFSKRGHYMVGVQASGTLAADGTWSSSAVAMLSFSVAPLSNFESGELDLEIAYEDGGLELALLDEENEREVDPADANLVGLPSTLEPVPNGTQFAFLGNPGDRIFILPQDEREGVLFLGIAGDEIPGGMFVDDAVSLNLLSVNGPGDVFLWSVDAFGAPMQYFDSADGVSEDDAFPVSVGGHSHQNWGFSAAGMYEVTLQASAVAVAGSETVTSDPTTFFFEIIEPEIFNEGELDIEVVYEEGEWKVALLDEANEREVEAAEALLQGTPATLQPVPDDPAFAFLGMPGHGVWILPQEETEGVLFLGIAGDEIPSGVFADETVSLELIEARGPGNVFLYAVDGFGAPEVFFDTTDGVDAADVYPVAVGGHAHVNWGFTAPGVYKLAVRPSGSTTGGIESGEVVELTFELVPPAPTLLDDYEFVLIDVPEAVGSRALGITDAGEIVGAFDNIDGVTQGFIYRDGNPVETLQWGGSSYTEVWSMNAAGQVLGYYADPADPDFGTFIAQIREPGGDFTNVDWPDGAPINFGIDINESGSVLGQSSLNSWIRTSDGNHWPFDIAGFQTNAGWGMDEAGNAVGVAWPGFFDTAHGFIYDAANEEFRIWNFPGAATTSPHDINNRGDIVGTFKRDVASAEESFIRWADGHLQLVQMPGAQGTRIWGVNDDGVIVGRILDAAGDQHAFMARPAIVVRAAMGSDEMLLLSWNAKPGKTYQVQSKTNDILGEWVDEGDPVQVEGSAAEVPVPVAGEQLKVFRVVELGA